jgi:uncharacterized protein (TIGR04222 family)
VPVLTWVLATHVLAAIQHLATWLVQQGGGWLEMYGLHLLYFATLLGCAALLRRLHRLAVESPEADPRHLPRGPRANSPHSLLFPYEAAYLAGGPQRVVETALASLKEEGWIEASAGGRLRLGGRWDLVAAPDPVAIGVLAVVAGGPPRPAGEIRRRAAHIPEIGAVTPILYARRLLVAEATRRRLQLLRLATAALLAVAGVALLVAVALRSPELTSPPVIAAAAALVIGVATPTLAWTRPLFRTAQGDADLLSLQANVQDKARWVAGRVWSDRQEGRSAGAWTDVDRIVEALARPPAGRPVQLSWLWGREDGQMAIALGGAPGIPDRGLRRSLQTGGRSMSKATSSTALSTPVHKMVRPDDA